MTANSLKSAYFLYVLLTAVAGGVGAIAVTRGSLDPVMALRLFLAFFSISVVVGTPFMLVWWRKTDEAVREAHKWAWFWGGSIGMSLIILIATLNAFAGGALFAPAIASAGLSNYAFELGAVSTILLMSYGYMGAWAYWWARHR